MRALPKPFNLQAILQIGLIILMIALLIVFLTREMENVRTFIRASGWLGLLVSLGIYALLGLTPIPSEPLTIMLGTIYHPLTASLIAGTGNLMAALVEYFIGQRLSKIANFEQRRQHLPFGLGKVPVNSAMFLLVTRLLPGYGPKFVSVMGGVYRVPLWRYIWTAAIPTYLGAAILAYGGSGLLHGLLGK